MIVTILFFAQARDRAKRASQTIDMPAGSRVADVVAHLKREHPELEPLWPHLAIALDGKLDALMPRSPIARSWRCCPR